MLGLADVRAAAERIRPYVVHTPLEFSPLLSGATGAAVWLKFECFQRTGSFKLRGAINALLLLPEVEKRRGVVTASAGNHGLGVARAAELLGLQATVVVPETASQAKIDALTHSQAELMRHGQTYDDAEAEARRLSRERGVPFISGYNDAAVVAGGGTVALEILDELPDARTIIVPAGGGGLVSGIGLAAHGVSSRVTVVGVQSVASPALHAALKVGAVVYVDVQPSLADGLAGNVEPDTITLELIRTHVSHIELVEEADIAATMRWLLENEHVLVEGSAAVGVSVLLQARQPFEGPVVVVLTGRNVAAAVLQQYVLA